MAVALALVIAQSPPLPKPPPMSVVTTVRGWGDRVEHFARVTVHFFAVTDSGKIFVDTEKRGMPFTFLMGQDNVEGFWHTAVENARVGDVRTVTIAASSVGVLLDGDPAVVLTIRIVKVARL